MQLTNEKIYTFRIAFIRHDGSVVPVYRNTTVREVQEYAQKAFTFRPGKFWDYEITNTGK